MGVQHPEAQPLPANSPADPGRAVPLGATAPQPATLPPPLGQDGATGGPHVPDHELLRKIGGGSYGEVWLARNVVATLRAVKIVSRRDFSEAYPFEREFKGIQKYEPVSRSHEGLIDILQIGRNEAAGYFYYVMELADDAAANPRSETRNPKEIRNPKAEYPTVKGSIRGSDFGLRNSDFYTPRTLRTELKTRGRLPLAECIQLGLSLCRALEHLHRRGLVHRDIKPSNIIFVAGAPKLADVGLVADVGEARSYVGTEGFIPPEGPGSVQADLYSLGKVLYEMSMGRSRLDFPALPANWDELPADQHARLLEFNEVLVKACESDPRRRYRSAHEMHGDLAMLERGKSVKQKRATQKRRAVAKKAALGAAIVALLSLSAFGLFTSFSLRGTWRDAQPVGRSLTSNLDALNAYSQGRYAYNKNSGADMTNAIRFFERAIALDPNFAEAYAGLASCYTWLDPPRSFPKARQPAEQALRLNPNLPEAHKCSALVKYTVDWRFSEAEEEFKLAIRLDPRDGETLRAYGNYLKTMGRTKEAIAVLTRAHELDPRAISTTEMLGNAFFEAGDYEQALRQFQTCLDLEPNHPATRYYMSQVYEEQGLFLKAIDLEAEDDVLTGQDRQTVSQRSDALRNAYNSGGANAYWRKSLELAKEDPSNGPFDFAELYARLGDKESAIRYLEEAVQKRDPALVMGLKISPAFRKFRKEPEFIALLKKMKWE